MNQNRVLDWEPPSYVHAEFLNLAEPTPKRPFHINDALFYGAKGQAKTTVLLMDYAQFVGRGYGPRYNGIFCRQTRPMLKNAVQESQIWFPNMFPGAEFNRQTLTWLFPDGETLSFLGLLRPEDYQRIHGHSYQWIAFDELCDFPTEELYMKAQTCLRIAGGVEVPLRARAATNPYGVGTHWVQKHFASPEKDGKIHRVTHEYYDPDLEQIVSDSSNRMALFADMGTNRHVGKGYRGQTIINTAGNKALQEAWVKGKWDDISGSFYGDILNPKVHFIPQIHVNPDWSFFKAHDWGSGRPCSTGWFARTTNSGFLDVYDNFHHTVAGDIILFDELYMKHPTKTNCGPVPKLFPAQQAQMILEYEAKVKIEYEINNISGAYADAAIFNDTGTGKTVAEQYEEEGLVWEPALKTGAGGRVPSAAYLRKLLVGALPPKPRKDDSGQTVLLPREKPGFFITMNCEDSMRTLKSLPTDPKNPDDADSSAEDHAYDMIRYALSGPIPEYIGSHGPSWGR